MEVTTVMRSPTEFDLVLPSFNLLSDNGSSNGAGFPTSLLKKAAALKGSFSFQVKFEYRNRTGEPESGEKCFTTIFE